MQETKMSTKKLDLKFQEAVDKLLHFEEFQGKVYVTYFMELVVTLYRAAIVPSDEFDKAVGVRT
jgi:hypothetical protein